MDKILDTGGGILNMIEQSNENDFIIFNPDIVEQGYIVEINKMQDIYFQNLNNILLLTKKKTVLIKILKAILI